MTGWLDDLEPFEPEQSERQVTALLRALEATHGPGASVLDVGAGGGRVTAPVLAAGFSQNASCCFSTHMRRFGASMPVNCMKFRPGRNGIGPGT